MTATTQSPVSPLAAYEHEHLFAGAHTANSFTDQPVSEDELRAIYDMVKWGPTAINSQPLRIAWVTSPEAHDRLVPLMSEGNRAKTAQAPVVALIAADLDFHENLPTVFPHNPAAKDNFADEGVRRSVATMNAAIQLGYLIVAIRAGRTRPRRGGFGVLPRWAAHGARRGEHRPPGPGRAPAAQPAAAVRAGHHHVLSRRLPRAPIRPLRRTEVNPTGFAVCGGGAV